jgi:hypothetical protein
MVLKAGCEAPNMEQSSTSLNQQLQQEDEQQLRAHGRNREPFRYYCYHCSDPSQVLDSLIDENFANMDDQYNEIEGRMSEELCGAELGVRMNVSTLSGQDCQQLRADRISPEFYNKVYDPGQADRREKKG